MEDMLRELNGMRQRASALQKLIAEAQSSAPSEAVGSDRSGSVLVRLGADGLPRTVRVEQGWRRNIPAAQLGDAVLDAAHMAMVERSRSWTANFPGGDWRGRLDALQEEYAATPVPAEAEHTTPLDATPVASRAIGEVMEDVLALLDSGDSPSQSGTRVLEWRGTAAAGKVRVTVSRQALIRCDVDPRWAERQTDSQLSSALESAFTTARAALAGSVQDGSAQPGGRAQALFQEALAMLRNP
ncbi:hypothetical protein [Streptacidiphilus sp. EB129]|uniref:hypothetical protein n=1 Tax=Streptacidiphilus sp. EB129 TaxID=3156262 RepID=UPI003517FA7D